MLVADGVWHGALLSLCRMGVGGWMSEWIGGWVGEWMNEWIGGWAGV